MTTIDLYRKHKVGEVSREKFLYEVRRDNNLPFITNLTSYDDAVKILKNKGIVTEAEIPTRQMTGDDDADWMGEIDDRATGDFTGYTPLALIQYYISYTDTARRGWNNDYKAELEDRKNKVREEIAAQKGQQYLKTVDDLAKLVMYATSQGQDGYDTLLPKLEILANKLGFTYNKIRSIGENLNEADWMGETFNDEEGSGYSYDYQEGPGASPQEIARTIKNFQSDMYTWNKLAKNDFYSMAQGDSADIKTDYYPKWKRSDFEQVIAALEGGSAMSEDFNLFKKMKDYAGEQGWTFSARRPTDEEDTIGREYMRSQGKELGSIGVDRITGNINVMEPNGDFRAILSPEGEELSAYEMRFHENLNESDTKEAKADEAVKAEVKPKAPSTKKPKTLHIDFANPYEYRHGLAHELHQLDDYSADALAKAKIIVLKNLAKDANFYSNLLNQQQSHYAFKSPETNKPGMQAKADGYLKKELKKNEKANVKDNLGNKEAGTTKPKGVKVMPDKGVTGTQKTIKENITEHHNDPNFPGGPKIYAMLDAISKDWGKDSDLYNELEDTIVGYVDNNGNLTNMGKAKIKALLSNYDVLEDYSHFLDNNIEEGSFMGGVDLGSSFDKMKQDIIGNKEDFELADENAFEDLMKKYDFYAEMSDDDRKWDAQQAMNSQLKMLAKKIGVEKAVKLFNQKAPADRKVKASFFGINEDKHAKIKEALKKALKEADVALKPVDDNIAKKETELANLYTQKANILKKPGSQT